MLRMTSSGKSSHVGLGAVVCRHLGRALRQVLTYRSRRAGEAGRDRFIMSKGHAGAAVYAALAESGFFDPRC